MNTTPSKYTYPIYEVSRYPNSSVTDNQLNNAWQLYNRTFSVAKSENWFNKKQAVNSGYKNTTDHAGNPQFFRDKYDLNPNRPEFLMYRPANGLKESVLVGAMYMVDINDKGKQVGGPITKWHFHSYPEQRCFSDGTPNKKSSDECPDKYFSKKSPEMLHVWFVDHPESQFATDMSIPRKTIEKGPEKLNQTEFYNKIEGNF